MKRAQGRRLPGTGELRAKLIEALPYSLTGAQTEALEEILRDMASGDRMLRLLQGDVGSGKTVVALLALAAAVESGAQGALMVPTEILARQHHATLSKLCAAAGISIALLTGREKGKTREEILARVASGEMQIAGRHPCAVPGRCGVPATWASSSSTSSTASACTSAWRLQAKAGGATDLLVMTATPIPRTLALTVYGDMDVSKLTEKPAGRLPIDTRVHADVAHGRGDRRPGAQHGAGQPRLLGVPAGGGERGRGPRRRGGPLPATRLTLQGPGGPRPRPHEGAGQGPRDGGVQGRHAEASRLHHGDRGGRRRSRSHRHGDRECRALRPCAAAPAARAAWAGAREIHLPAALPGAAGRNGQGPALDHARDGGRLPHRRGRPAPARCGRNAGHAPVRPAAVPHGGPLRRRRSAGRGAR